MHRVQPIEKLDPAIGDSNDAQGEGDRMGRSMDHNRIAFRHHSAVNDSDARMAERDRRNLQHLRAQLDHQRKWRLRGLRLSRKTVRGHIDQLQAFGFFW